MSAVRHPNHLFRFTLTVATRAYKLFFLFNFFYLWSWLCFYKIKPFIQLLDIFLSCLTHIPVILNQETKSYVLADTTFFWQLLRLVFNELLNFFLIQNIIRPVIVVNKFFQYFSQRWSFWIVKSWPCGLPYQVRLPFCIILPLFWIKHCTPLSWSVSFFWYPGIIGREFKLHFRLLLYCFELLFLKFEKLIHFLLVPFLNFITDHRSPGWSFDFIHLLRLKSSSR